MKHGSLKLNLEKLEKIKRPINHVLREKDNTSFTMNLKVPIHNENHVILLYEYLGIKLEL